MLQLLLAAQATQPPSPSHTWSVPQVVPAATLVPSAHTGAPEVQSSAPAMHGAPALVVQAAPLAQATQPPLPSHTCPAPQAVPAATAAPSLHTGVPEAHSITPATQGPPGLVPHPLPAAQATQLPEALHTFALPHEVPAVSGGPSTHASGPQAVLPALHGAPGLPVQATPGVQVPASFGELDEQLQPDSTRTAAATTTPVSVRIRRFCHAQARAP